MFDVGGVADGVALLVKGDVAGHAVVGHARQSGLDRGGIGGAGRLQGFQRYIVGVVAHGGDSGDGVVAAVVGQGVRVAVDVVLDPLVKFGRAALLVKGRDIQLDVGALGSRQDHVVIQGIGAQEGRFDAQRGGLLDDLGGVGDGDGGEDDVCALVLGLVQVGAEVGVVGGEGRRDDGAARSLERLGKVGDQALVVLVAGLAQAVGHLRVKLVRGEVGQDGALEGVQEADAVVIIVARGDVGVGAGDADGGQAGVVKDGAAGNGHARTVGAQHQGDALAHQLGSGRGGLVGGRAVVCVDQLDLVGLAADLDGGGLGVGVLHPQHLLLAAGGRVAGGRLKDANLDDLVPRGGRAASRRSGRAGRGGRGPAAAQRRNADGRGRSQRYKPFAFHKFFLPLCGTKPAQDRHVRTKNTSVLTAISLL